ncbi:hypothetical protein F2Q69_00001670 [Brassica cretica]|uniref:Leucine-rich repeat-containing N-terminal plant-type domain-containing protein n=1 Tax=Brassica cretica TaxID=69181 RepID=A0A8S9NQ50_BRACR|nr:hypothetical protein F2Q69_00001670 [Brassica cretica]
MGHILSLAWASDLCGPIVFMQARRTLDRVLGPDMRRVKFTSNNIPLQIWRVSDRQTGDLTWIEEYTRFGMWTSRVIKIDLRTRNQTANFDEFKQSCLGGKINPSLIRLKFLSYLDLSSNDFNGLEISEFIGHMVSLRYLNLSLASFSGEVPASLGNLSKLESLDMYTRSLNENGWPSFDLRASNLGWLSGLSSSLT